MKLDAIKDGLGNIIITEDSFEFLLTCLEHQKFKVSPVKQDVIDNYNNECKKILQQRYIFETFNDGYFLFKKYKYQDKIIPWSGDDVSKAYELFDNTEIKYKKPENLKQITDEEYIFGDTPLGVDENGWIICEPEPRPWLIERPTRYDNDYLTISEDGHNNRPWKEEEIKSIQMLFNGLEVHENGFYKEELWNDQLSKMENSVIENYLRKSKLNKLK